MKATVLGVQKVDYKKGGERKKSTTYYISFASEGIEGVETASIWIDEVKYGAAPKYVVGEQIDVCYNKFGNLRLGV